MGHSSNDTVLASYQQMKLDETCGFQVYSCQRQLWPIVKRFIVKTEDMVTHFHMLFHLLFFNEKNKKKKPHSRLVVVWRILHRLQIAFHLPLPPPGSKF